MNAKKEGLRCDLSYEDFCELVSQGGLVSSQLGFTGEGYVLARYNDKGDYTIGNCRFITHKENVAEKQISECSRKTSQRNVQKAIISQKGLSHEELSAQVKNSEKWQRYNQQRQERKQARNLERRLKMHPSYMGERNSQFASFWITNGECNKKWKEDYGEIPFGWRRGRVM